MKKEGKQDDGLWKKILIQQNNVGLSNPVKSRYPDQSINNFLHELHHKQNSEPRISLESLSSVLSVHDITFSEQTTSFCHTMHPRNKALLAMLVKIIAELQSQLKKDVIKLQQDNRNMIGMISEGVYKLRNQYQKQLQTKNTKIKQLQEELHSKKSRVLSLIQNRTLRDLQTPQFAQIRLKNTQQLNQGLKTSPNRIILPQNSQNFHEQNTNKNPQAPSTSVSDYMKKRFTRTKNGDQLPNFQQKTVKKQNCEIQGKYLSPKTGSHTPSSPYNNLKRILTNSQPLNSSVRRYLQNNSKQNWFKSSFLKKNNNEMYLPTSTRKPQNFQNHQNLPQQRHYHVKIEKTLKI